jgi:hypothetical protein
MKKEINAFDLKDLKEEMKKEGISRLSELNNIAVNTMSNWGGAVILINKTGESVFYQEDYSQEGLSLDSIEEFEIKYYSCKELNDMSDIFDYLEEEELYAGFEVPGYDGPFLLNEFIRSDYLG